MNENIFLCLRGAKRFAMPLPDLWRTSSLSEDDLRAYWRFRRLFMDLKPHIDPEEDWARFHKWLKDADFSWLKRAPDGHLVGLISFKVEHRVHEARPLTLLWPEYGYSLPEARKSMGLALATLCALGLCLSRYPRAPLYVAGTAYLPSFVALAQIFQTQWLWDEPSMSAWEQSLWRSLAEATPGYDPVRKIIRMGTIPRNPRTSPPRIPKVLEAWRRYMAHNPRWTEGYTCMCMGPVQPSLLCASARWFGAKAWRKP